MTTALPTDELTAVNTILSNLGEEPVNSLTGDNPLDAAQALGVLREVNLEVQKRGWYFNTEVHLLNPDTSGYIFVPKNSLQVRTVDEDRGTLVVQRGDKLYNMTPRHHGFKFSKGLNLQIILGIHFDDLPQTARSYIALRAARVFQIRQLGDEMNSRDDTADEKMAMAELHQEQLRAAPYSLRDSVSVSAALSQRPVMNIKI